MRKLFAFLLVLLVVAPARAFTLPTGAVILTSPSQISSYTILGQVGRSGEPGSYLYGTLKPTNLGAIPRPENAYSKNITQSLSLGGSDTTITVSELPHETTGYLIINPNSSASRELIKYTSVSTTLLRLEGVTRGLAEYGTTGVAISDARVAANAKRHSSGEQIVMSNGRYEQLIIDQLNGLTTSSIKATDQTFTVSSSLYFGGANVAIRNSGGVLQWSIDNFASSFNFTSSSISQLSASSTAGIGVTDSQIHLIVSTTLGMAFGPDGRLYQKTSSTLAVENDSDGIKINTTTLVNLIATGTPAGFKIPISTASGTIREVWIATSTTSTNPFLRSSPTGAYWGDFGGPLTTTTEARAFNTVYQNTSGKPKLVTISFAISDNAGSATGRIFVSSTPTTGYQVFDIYINSGGIDLKIPATFLVLPNWYYKVVTETGGSGTITKSLWYEIEL